MADESTPLRANARGTSPANEFKPTPRQHLEQLRAEHAHLEEKLAEYDQRIHLSVREQLERKRLQKLKLRVKDNIVHYESFANTAQRRSGGPSSA